MKSHRFLQQYEQYETGAGLVEYSPLILTISCLLFSLYQVMIQQQSVFLCLIGAIVIGIPAYAIGFIIYDNRRTRNKNEP